MYDEYSFVLEFDDLSDELIERKIDEMIEFDYNNGNIDKEDGKSLNDYMIDKEYRDNCKHQIDARFPIYF